MRCFSPDCGLPGEEDEILSVYLVRPVYTELSLGMTVILFKRSLSEKTRNR